MSISTMGGLTVVTLIKFVEKNLCSFLQKYDLVIKYLFINYVFSNITYLI